MQNEEQKNKVLQEFEGLLSTLKTQNNNSNVEHLINLITQYIGPNSEHIATLRKKSDKEPFYHHPNANQHIRSKAEDNIIYAEDVIYKCIAQIQSKGLYVVPAAYKNFLGHFSNSELIAIITAFITVFGIIPTYLSLYQNNQHQIQPKPKIYKTDTTIKKTKPIYQKPLK